MVQEHTHHRFSDSGVCYKHEGLTTAIIDMKETRIADNVLNEKEHLAQWTAIDKMRESINMMTRWIMGAMGAAILAFGSWLLTNFHIINIGK
jgi:hypothetical protein